MSVFDRLTEDVIDLFLYTQANKYAAQQQEQIHDLVQVNTELDRRKKVNHTRRQMPCLHKEKFSYSIFKALAVETADQITRIKSVSVYDATVFITVESQSGLSNWDFYVDFNNWGHIDGTYWICTDNSDSTIPKHYGELLSNKICNYLYEHNIFAPNFSAAVDANKLLETEHGLNTHYRKSIIRKALRCKGKCVNVMCDASYLCGEHIYPVISLLKQAGFVNIKSIPIDDIDYNSRHYMFEVERVSIAGTNNFNNGYAFPQDAEILIYYHRKRRIVLPSTKSNFKRKNYVEVGDYLRKLGFTEIYERKIKDLVFGIITKDGSVENVFVDDGDENPISPGKVYDYDKKIIICYHTYK